MFEWGSRKGKCSRETGQRMNWQAFKRWFKTGYLSFYASSDTRPISKMRLATPLGKSGLVRSPLLLLTTCYCRPSAMALCFCHRSLDTTEAVSQSLRRAITDERVCMCPNCRPSQHGLPVRRITWDFILPF